MSLPVTTPEVGVSESVSVSNVGSSNGLESVGSKFDSFGLSPLILKAVSDLGYTQPTPVQERSIPVALAGQDILASAQTGTGKTAAFILPALHKLSIASKVATSKGPRVLVLTPTRELAMQVSTAARNYGKQLRQLNIVCILGGVPYDRQRRDMRRHVDLMVATPGRLMDFLNQGAIDFDRIEMLVLDEADRMLDMGFRDSVKEIADLLPEKRQNLLFSATIDRQISELAKGLLVNPVRIEVTPQKAKHDNIEQQLHYVSDISSKKKLLLHLLTKDGVDQAIIFTATKRGADQLAKTLSADGHEVGALHGDMRQNARTRTIRQLRDGELRILVATDVAARGLDVKNVSHIINFDLPRMSEDYVHRIGRTGRAGARGVAISLAYPRERGQIRQIESYIGHPIVASTIPGFEVAANSRSEGSEHGEERRGGRRSFGGGRSQGGRSSGRRSSGDRSYGRRSHFSGDSAGSGEREHSSHREHGASSTHSTRQASRREDVSSSDRTGRPHSKSFEGNRSEPRSFKPRGEHIGASRDHRAEHQKESRGFSRGETRGESQGEGRPQRRFQSGNSGFQGGRANKEEGRGFSGHSKRPGGRGPSGRGNSRYTDR